MFVKTMKKAGIGFLVGVLAGNLIIWLSGASGGLMISPELIARVGSETGAMAVQTLTMGLYGAVCMGGMMLYRVESWSLALSTAVHYLMIAVLFVLMDRALCWNDSSKTILLIELIQLVAFVFIWLIIYLRYKSEVRSLNEELKGLSRNAGIEKGEQREVL